MLYTVEALKEFLSNQKRPGLALDIDDTLCITGLFWYAELVKIGGHPGLTFEEIREKYGKFKQVPGWGEDQRVIDWMNETIITGRHHLDYQVIDNAKERVAELMEIIPIHAYITMRPASVVTHTIEWLDMHGFPRLPILARPQDMSTDQIHAWKGNVLHQLYPLIAGIVDDDPHVIEELPKGYKGTIFLFGDRKHLPNDAEVIRCENWDEVYTQVKSHRLVQAKSVI